MFVPVMVQRPVTNRPAETTTSVVKRRSGKARDIEHILAQLTDDVDWASCPGSDIAPWHGVHQGPAEVPAFFKDLLLPRYRGHGPHR